MLARSCARRIRRYQPTRSINRRVILAFLGLVTTLSSSYAFSSRLPIKVAIPAHEGHPATGWDFNGDGRPDFVHVHYQSEQSDGKPLVNKAYDFDGDGKPDYFRSSATDKIHKQTEKSINATQSHNKPTESSHEHSQQN